MRETVTRITTADTEKTYELPGENVPQLWEAELAIRAVEEDGEINRPSSPEVIIYIERQTLVNAGLLPEVKDDVKPTEDTKETPEGLLLRLLEHVGIYPQE